MAAMKSEDQPFAVGFVNDRWEAGVAGLSHEAEYIYFRLCKAMWATGEGVLVEDAPAVCRFHPKFKSALQALLRAGKVRQENDRLVNDRALEEYARAVERQAKNRGRGKAGAAARWGASPDASSNAQASAHAHAQASARAKPKQSVSTSSSNSHPDPYPLEKNPSSSAKGSARARPATGDAAAGLIRLFDEKQDLVYGAQQRQMPAVRDHSTAQRFLDAGLTEAEAGPLFEAVLRRELARGKPAPRSLAYLEQPVADHLAERSKPLPQGQPTGRDADPEGGTVVNYDPAKWLSPELLERRRRIVEGE